MKTSDEMVLELPAPQERSLRRPASAAFQSRNVSSPSPSFNGALVGTLAGISDDGVPLVDFAGNLSRSPLPARPAAAFAITDIGRDAVLLFEAGDPARPILIAFLAAPKPEIQSAVEARPVEVKLDGEQLTFSAKNEIVLRCGKSSITLTRAGKVIIRGAYLLSRSSGANRIKGGSVQIN
jgi:hypothetical protein